MPWPVRLALGGLLVLAVVLVWTTNHVLTQRFAEASMARAEVRLADFAGTLVGELDRQEVVPFLLARDGVLFGALASEDFSQTSQHLIRFQEELGAASLALLDAAGKQVAGNDRSRLSGDHQGAPYFTAALKAEETVFTVIEDTVGQRAFYFSRNLSRAGEVLGVIVVEVDLHQFLERWSRLSRGLALLDAEGEVILATDPRWVGLSSGELANRLYEAVANSGLGPWARVVGRGDGMIDGRVVLRQEASVGDQGWRLAHYTDVAQIRDRVNLVLAVEVAVFAILIALIFFALSRQAERRSARLVHESDRLRTLNQRLQAEIAERERAERNLQVAEQSLAQSSKMAALGEMSAAISHELNQPLAAMKTYLAGARLLLTRARPDEALASFHRLNGLIDRMASITRQLKSHARKDSEEMRPVDLRDCLASAMDIMAPRLSRSHVRITRTVPDEPVVIMADPVRIEQVIVNLLRNGLDATKGVRDPQVDVLLTAGEAATLSVRDNGHGIEDLGALFEPFYTTKPAGEGLGLGLAISSTIVASMGGRLTARNGSTGGAVFKVDLPIAQADAAETAPPSNPDVPSAAISP